MATFNIPFCKVSYQGRVSSDGGVINEPYFYAYWGATVEGEYLSNPYRLKITKISLHHRWKCNGGSGFRVFFFNKPSKYRIVVASYKGTSSRYDSVSVTVNATGDSGGYCNAGDVFNNYGNWTGSLELPLASEGGKLRLVMKMATTTV